jgi:hypothetical protein
MNPVHTSISQFLMIGLIIIPLSNHRSSKWSHSFLVSQRNLCTHFSYACYMPRQSSSQPLQLLRCAYRYSPQCPVLEHTQHMNSNMLWDVTPCSPTLHRCFGRTDCLHLHRRRVGQASKLLAACFLLVIYLASTLKMKAVHCFETPSNYRTTHVTSR